MAAKSAQIARGKTVGADKNIIVGLDIGTSKVVCLVGRVDPDGTIEVIGLGSHKSNGLRKGVVVNIESTVQSIQRAVEEAELMSGCAISTVHVGIAGSHISSQDSDGAVSIRNREVQQADIDRVIEAAQAVPLPADRKVLHILPQDYIIDNQEGVHEPLGMSGVRLESRVHIITCAVNALQNIEKCVRRCNLDVESVILEQLASSYAVLTKDEKDLGVALVDIGGGTADIAVYTNGTIKHTAVIPIAGDQVTNDIAMAFSTPTTHAEELKIQYACAKADMAQRDSMVKVQSVGDRGVRELSRQALAEVVEPRYDELFGFVLNELRRSGYLDMLAAGIVLTGGTSKIEGAVELAEEVFHMPVRVGAPVGITGLGEVVKNPIYSTGIGLLLYGLHTQQERQQLPVVDEVGDGSLFRKLKHWFNNNF